MAIFHSKWRSVTGCPAIFPTKKYRSAENVCIWSLWFTYPISLYLAKSHHALFVCPFPKDLLTTRALKQIREHDPEEPLFMYFAHAGVHIPLQVNRKTEFKNLFVCREILQAIVLCLVGIRGANFLLLSFASCWSNSDCCLITLRHALHYVYP